ncbi:hypothetical protein FRC17_004184, partial [Serendipita sp. 399]
GQPISKIAPREDPSRFWADVFVLDVDSSWLAKRLNGISREECLHEQKILLGQIFKHALQFFTQSKYSDGEEEQRRRRNALETLVVLFHSVLQKDLAGWEIMDLLSGNMSESDLVFGQLVEGIESTLESTEAPVALKHRTLQLALVFACGIGQLSPGAYLLRRDLFPSIVMVSYLLIFIDDSTTPFTFEAILLLSVLLNYHKSEAANLNPYLRRVRGSVDHTFLSKVSWALGYAFDTASKKYQEIQDDAPPTLASTFGSFLTALRPDRALSSTPVETPKELFKDQPIEATAGLLPLYELLQLNPVFTSVIVESLTIEGGGSTTNSRPPMIFSFISLASYLFTHASSVGTQRSLAYANLTMRIIALMASDEPMIAKFARESGNYNLDIGPTADTTRLTNVRAEYHWEELWKSILVLLEFTSSRVDKVKVLGRVEELIEELSTLTALEVMIPSPNTQPRGAALTVQAQAARAITTIQSVIAYYGSKINETGGEMEIGDVMKVIGAEVERDGLHIASPREPEAPT